MTGQHRNRPERPGADEPGPDSARADALLRATNAFLRSDALPDLARALTDAVGGMFGDATAAVTFVQPDGSMALMSTAGLASSEVDRIAELVQERSGVLAPVFAGAELWTDDPAADELRARISALGGKSFLAIPIRTASGVAGTLSLMFADKRGFDAGFRDAIRSLAAQAGLAYELIAARDELRRSAADADTQRRVATAFYTVASCLASVTQPGVVPHELVVAIQAATGARAAAVALRKGDTDEFEIVAVEGATPEQAAIMAATPLTPEHFPGVRALLDGVAVAGSEPSAMATRLDLGGGAAAPIIVEGTVRGFLSTTVAPGDPFDPESWQELVMGFASVAATALARVEAVAEVTAQREILASAVAERTVQLSQAITELRSASEAKSDLLANVSHELRTPLTAILGFSEILVRGDDGPLNPRQHEDATTILASTRRLVELIDDLIDISRIEGNRLELHIQPVALRPLLASVVEELRALAGAKGIGLSFKAASAPLVLDGDAVRLREVFINLVSNAVKFTGPGGTVRIEAVLESPPDRSAPNVRVDVIDSGIGVPPEEQERIFEKFHRIASPEYSGTGLGLAIARELVRRHGGSLTVESTVGLGSRFTVVLPLAPAEDRPA